MGLVVLCIVYGILTTVSFVLIRMSGGVELSNVESVFLVRLPVKFIFGLVTYVSSFILYLFIIPQLNFTRTFPILNGVVYSLIVLSGIIVFHEKFTMQHIIGLLLVLSGVVVLGLANPN